MQNVLRRGAGYAGFITIVEHKEHMKCVSVSIVQQRVIGYSIIHLSICYDRFDGNKTFIYKGCYSQRTKTNYWTRFQPFRFCIFSKYETKPNRHYLN